MQFSSKPPFNDDPKPYVVYADHHRTTCRWQDHSAMSQAGVEYLGSYDPRPEYDRPQTNPTNRILDEIRSEATDMEEELRMVCSQVHYHDRTPEERDHALKVLRKWKAVYGEEG